MVQQSRSDSEDASASSAYSQGASNGGTMSENVSHLTDINEQKGRAASALREVASTLRERATSAPLPGMDVAAQAAARPLETSAAYLEEHTPGDMWADLMSFCRDHPAGALGIGFMVGYLFHKLFR